MAKVNTKNNPPVFNSLADTINHAKQTQETKKPTYLQEKLGPAPVRSKGLAVHYNSPDLSEMDQYQGYVADDVMNSGEYDLKTINQIAEQNQSFGDSLAQGAQRVALNVVPEIVKGVAAIVDVPGWFDAQKGATNSVVNAMNDVIAQTNKDIAPIFEDPDNPLEMGDLKWWSKNGSSLATSALSFVAQGAMLGGAVGGLSKLAQMARVKSLAQMAAKAGGITNAAKFTNTLGRGLETLTTAALLNQSEATLSATDAYNNTMNHWLEKGHSEGYAKKQASIAAATTYNINRANIALNLVSANMFLQPMAMTRQLLTPSSIGKTLKTLGSEGLQEAGEEMINNIAQKAGEAHGRGERFGLQESVKELGSKDSFESAFLGALGGVAQTGMGHALRRTKYAPSATKDAEGNRISAHTYEKQRYETQQKVIQDMKDNGSDIVKSFTDMDEQVKLQHELQAYAQAGNQAKYNETRNKLFDHVALQAFQSGTTEVLEDLIKSAKSDETFGDQGIGDDSIKSAVEKLKVLENVYNNYEGYSNVNDIFYNRANELGVKHELEKANQNLMGSRNQLDSVAKIIAKKYSFEKTNEILFKKDGVVDPSKTETRTTNIPLNYSITDLENNTGDNDVNKAKYEEFLNEVKSTDAYQQHEEHSKEVDDNETKLEMLDKQFAHLKSPKAQEEAKQKEEEQKIDEEHSKAIRDEKTSISELERIAKESKNPFVQEAANDKIEEKKNAEKVKSQKKKDDTLYKTHAYNISKAKDIDELNAVAKQIDSAKDVSDKMKEQLSRAVAERQMEIVNGQQSSTTQQGPSTNATNNVNLHNAKTNSTLPKDFNPAESEEDFENRVQKTINSLNPRSTLEFGYDGRTSEGHDRAAYQARAFDQILNDDVVTREDIDNALNDINPDILNPDKLNAGTEIILKVDVDYDGNVYDSESFEKGTKTWADRRKEIGNDEELLANEIPIVAINKATGEKIFYVHDVNWINEENVDASPAELAIDKKKLQAIRKKIIESGSQGVSTTISEKTPGVLFKTAGNAMMSVAEAMQDPNLIISVCKNEELTGNLPKGKIKGTKELREGETYAIIPYGNEHIAIPLRRTTLDKKTVNTIIGAIRIYLTGEESPEIKEMMIEISKQTGYDVSDIVGLRNFISNFVYVFPTDGSLKDAAGVTSDKLSEKNRLITVNGNSIEIGIPGIDKSFKNLSKNTPSDMVDSLLNQFQKHLLECLSTAERKSLEVGRKIVYINEDGTLSEPVDYKEHIKNSFETNIMSVKIDTDKGPKYVYTIQQGIKYDTSFANNVSIEKNITSVGSEYNVKKLNIEIPSKSKENKDEVIKTAEALKSHYKNIKSLDLDDIHIKMNESAGSGRSDFYRKLIIPTGVFLHYKVLKNSIHSPIITNFTNITDNKNGTFTLKGELKLLQNDDLSTPVFITLTQQVLSDYFNKKQIADKAREDYKKLGFKDINEAMRGVDAAVSVSKTIINNLILEKINDKYDVESAVLKPSFEEKINSSVDSDAIQIEKQAQKIAADKNLSNEDLETYSNQENIFFSDEFEKEKKEYKRALEIRNENKPKVAPVDPLTGKPMVIPSETKPEDNEYDYLPPSFPDKLNDRIKDIMDELLLKGISVSEQNSIINYVTAFIVNETIKDKQKNPRSRGLESGPLFTTIKDALIARVKIYNENGAETVANRLQTVVDQFPLLQRLSKIHLEYMSTNKISDEEVDNSDDASGGLENTLFSDDWSIGLDSKSTASADLKKYFSFIEDKQDGLTKTNSLGFPEVIPFDVVYNTLHEVLAGLPADYDVIEKQLADYTGRHPWLQSVIEKLDDAPQDIKNQFVSDMTKHSIKMKFMMWEKNSDGTYSLFSMDTNTSSIKDRLLTLWSQNIKDESNLVLLENGESKPLIFVNEDGEYSFDKDVAKTIVKQAADWQKEIKKKDSTFLPEPEQLREWLKHFGIFINDGTLNDLANGKYRNGGPISYRGLFTSSKGLVKVLANQLEKNANPTQKDAVAKTLEESKLLSDRVVKSLAELNAMYESNVFSNSFNSGTKTIYTFSNNKFVINQIRDLKNFDENNENKLISDLEDISLTRGSLLLEDLKNPALREHFGIDYLSLEALKKRFTSSKEDRKLNQISEDEHEVVKLALFFNNSGDVHDGENRRKVGFFYPTMSDKSSMMILNMMSREIELNESGELSQKSLDLLYKSVVQSEIQRISSDAKVKNIKGYEPKYFYFIPSMNTKSVEYNGSEKTLRDHVIDSNGDISEELEGLLKDELNSVFGGLVKAKLKDWNRLGIGKTIKENGKTVSKESFLNKDYMKNVAKGSSLDGSNINYAASDFVFNSLIANCETFKVVVGDPAQYAKFKKNETLEENLEQTFINLGKRLAADIAPGIELADAENNKYRQVFLNDKKLASKAYLNEIQKLLSPEVKAKYDLDKDGKGSIEGSDAQEYTTWKEHLYVLKQLGKITEAQHKLFSDTIESGGELSYEELGEVLQPVKPVYVGNHIEKENDTVRRVYIKSSSFPLIPQLTKTFEIDKIRKALETYENGTKGKTVRASFNTANKVGGIGNSLDVFDDEGNVLEGLVVSDENTLLLNRKNFRIQQEVPYDHEKEAVNIGTQARKLLFNNILDMDGFVLEGSDKKLSGKELEQLYTQNYKDLFEYKTKELKTRLGLIEKVKQSTDTKTLLNVRESNIFEQLSEMKETNKNLSKFEAIESKNKLKDELGTKTFKRAEFVNKNFNQIVEKLLEAKMNVFFDENLKRKCD